jgi:hypothetical protein
LYKLFNLNNEDTIGYKSSNAESFGKGCAIKAMFNKTFAKETSGRSVGVLDVRMHCILFRMIYRAIVIVFRLNARYSSIRDSITCALVSIYQLTD